MKKTLLAAGCALLAAAAVAAAEGTAVTLQNQEDSWFYFVIDPSDLAGVPQGSPLVTSRVAAFFARQSADFPFTALKPRAGLTLEALPEGSHFLVGFFVAEGKSVFPVRVLTLQVDTRLGQRFYGVYSEPPLMTLPRGVGLLARFGASEEPAAKPTPEAAAATPPAELTPPPTAASVAEQAPAAESVPAAEQAPAVEQTPAPTGPAEIASFSPRFSPAVFSREVRGELSVRPIAESRYWNREGTRIASVSGSRAGTSIVIEITSATRFSPDVSYFLYFFGSRTLGRNNRVTLEVKPVTDGGGPGVAALWSEGSAKPTSVGAVSVEGSTCRIALATTDLPAGLLSDSGGNPSVDLTACYFDAADGTYEEFSYTTFSLADLPAVTR